MTDTVSTATVSTATVTLPALGFGTWELRGSTASECVTVALDAGYRHIDTAQMYDNEEEVGQALASSSVARDDVFLTTKIKQRNAAPADVARSTAESLAKLKVDHVDLLLLHWPAEDVAPLEATLEAMTAARDQGLTGHIGVSNFPSEMLERACDLAPVVNDQVEHHPYLAVDAIRDMATRRDVTVTAYSPIAKGQVLDDPTLIAIAEEHGVTSAQVAIRWHLQRGLVAIPRSSSPERIRANADVFSFELTADEVVRIDGLARGGRLIDPSSGPTWDEH